MRLTGFDASIQTVAFWQINFDAIQPHFIFFKPYIGCNRCFGTQLTNDHKTIIVKSIDCRWFIFVMQNFTWSVDSVPLTESLIGSMRCSLRFPPAKWNVLLFQCLLRHVIMFKHSNETFAQYSWSQWYASTVSCVCVCYLKTGINWTFLLTAVVWMSRLSSLECLNRSCSFSCLNRLLC